MASSEPNPSDSSSWWAYCMFANDRVKEYVPLSDVFTYDERTEEKHPFRPKNVEDFEPKRRYIIKTTTGNEIGDDKKHQYWGFISKIGVSKQDCIEKASKKRNSFPECRERLDEPQSESSSNEHCGKKRTTGVDAVLACRDENKRKELAKRIQEQTDLQKIVASSVTKTTKKQEDDVIAMKEQIKRLEVALAKERQSKAATKFDPKALVEQIKNDLDEKIKDIGDSLQRNLVKSGADEVAKAVDQRMCDILRKSPDSPPLEQVAEWLNACPY